MAVGTYSMYSDVANFNNTAIGVDALYGNTTEGTGDLNTAVGFAALVNNYGSENTAVGEESLAICTTGAGNCALGSDALRSDVSGSDNTAIGIAALITNEFGSNNTAIGAMADVINNKLTNATAIGYGAIVEADNTIQLGNHDGVNDVVQVTIGNAITLGGSSNSNLSTGTFEVRNSPTLNWVLTCTDAATGRAEWRPTSCVCERQFNDQIADLKKENVELRKELDELKAMIQSNSNNNISGSIKLSSQSSVAQLFQNAPNPFTQSTIIKYTLPETAKKAILTITSISGIKLKEFDLKNDASQIQVSGGQLTAGTYIYTLMVDDVFIDAKQMILTK